MLRYSNKVGSFGGANSRVLPVRFPTAPGTRTESRDYRWADEGGEGGE